MGGISHRMFLRFAFKVQTTSLGLCICWRGCIHSSVCPHVTVRLNCLLADIHSTPLHHNYSVDFASQIVQWDLYARPVLPVDLKRALVAVWIGINDINDSDKYTYPRGNVSSYKELYDQIISIEFAALETVWRAGYRNFLFINLPPLEKTVRVPQYRSFVED